MLDFRRLGRGTKPNIIDGALPNLPINVLSVQALNNVSEFLQPTENIGIFWGFCIYPGNGIMVRRRRINFIVNPIGGGTINLSEA